MLIMLHMSYLVSPLLYNNRTFMSTTNLRTLFQFKIMSNNPFIWTTKCTTDFEHWDNSICLPNWNFFPFTPLTLYPLFSLSLFLIHLPCIPTTSATPILTRTQVSYLIRCGLLPVGVPCIIHRVGRQLMCNDAHHTVHNNCLRCLHFT